LFQFGFFTGSAASTPIAVSEIEPELTETDDDDL
jgi:hypothetical protein